MKNEKDVNIRKIIRIRSDHGKEFENGIFSDYCNKHGIAHEFFASKTPQQNGMVERKNRTLQEMVRVMINSNKLSTRLWVEAINTACNTINRVYLQSCTNKLHMNFRKIRSLILAIFMCLDAPVIF